MACLTNQLQPLTPNDLSGLLNSRNFEKAVNFVCKPKSGEVYVIKSSSEEKWKNDGYKWNQYGFISFPKNNPRYKKIFFQIVLNSTNMSKDFRKLVYKPMDYRFQDVTIVHYLGNDSIVSNKRNLKFINKNRTGRNINMFQRYNDSAKYLKDANYLDTLNTYRRKSLLQNIKYFNLENDQLFYKSANGLRLVLLSQKDVEFVIKEAHESTKNHLNNVETSQNIAKNFYWKTMLVDINKMVKSCQKCSKGNFKLNKKIWQSIKINIIGPISIEKENSNNLNMAENQIYDYKGNNIANENFSNENNSKNITDSNEFVEEISENERYVFAATDLFSGFLYVEILNNVKSTTISTELINLFMNLGCPQFIYIYQTDSFIKQLNTFITETSEFKTKIIPLSDEDQNLFKTENALTDLLTFYVDENILDWNIKIKSAVYGINSSYDETILASPFQLFMNRNLDTNI